MTKEKSMALKEALKNDDNFLAFLRHEAETGQYEKMKEVTKREPHPTGEMLYNYVLGLTSEEDKEVIMRHIAYCDFCLEEVLNIRRIEKELNEDLLEWANKPPLFDRLKELTSSLSFPVWAFDFDIVRGDTRPKEKEKEISQYAKGDRISFCIKVPSDGHLAVFHYDAAGRIRCVFPHNSNDSTFVSGGNEKRIVGKITEPLGSQSFKVIWSSRQLLYPQKIDFDNENEIERTMEKFFDSLAELHKTDWREASYEFEVIKV